MLVAGHLRTLLKRWNLLLAISTECYRLMPPLPLLVTGFKVEAFWEEVAFLVYRSFYLAYYIIDLYCCNWFADIQSTFRIEIILPVLDRSRLLFDNEPKLRECPFQLNW